MSTDVSHFRIRSASSTPDDCQFIIAAWDSVLPFLASIGAGEMWGSEPFSHREGFEQDIIDQIRESEQNQENDSRKVLIAELQVTANSIVKAGAAIIRDVLPSYLTENPKLKAEMSKVNSLLFIEVIISDFRIHPRCKGVGAALIEASKQRAMLAGKDALYLDAWAGNERKLNSYYEKFGFTEISDYSLRRKNGSTWVGTLHYIDLRSPSA